MSIKAVISCSGPIDLGRGTKADSGETVIVRTDAAGNQKVEVVPQSGHKTDHELNTKR
jgi:hypothetical protein